MFTTRMQGIKKIRYKLLEELTAQPQTRHGCIKRLIDTYLWRRKAKKDTSSSCDEQTDLSLGCSYHVLTLLSHK